MLPTQYLSNRQKQRLHQQQHDEDDEEDRRFFTRYNNNNNNNNSMMNSSPPTHRSTQQQQQRRQRGGRGYGPHGRGLSIPSPSSCSGPPSICVTGVMCRQGRYEVRRNNKSCNNSNVPAATATTTTTISYCIFRPRQIYDKIHPPLVVLHGGPSIPSNYLIPLVNVITNRTIIFYDQLGCGKSTRNPTITTSTKFNIYDMVNDLIELITNCWQLKEYHLYGHSYGGMLAYEYWKQITEKQQQSKSSNNSKLLSMTLASTPTSTKIAIQERQRLYHLLPCVQEQIQNDKEEHEQQQQQINNNNTSQQQQQQQKQYFQHHEEFSNEFFQQHECRLDHIPLVLMDAFRQAGPIPWRGLDAILDYVATPFLSLKEQQQQQQQEKKKGEEEEKDVLLLEEKEGNKTNNTNSNILISPSPTTPPPTLLLCGEYDVCTPICMEGWKQLLVSSSSLSLSDSVSTNPNNNNNTTNNDDTTTANRTTTTTTTKTVTTMSIVSNCSHYGMLEDETQYGQILSKFFLQHDPTTITTNTSNSTFLNNNGKFIRK